MNSSATLLLIRHSEAQQIEAPAAWGIFDNRDNPDYQLCEVGAFLRCFLGDDGEFFWPFETSHAGLLSPKFFRKTRMNSEKLASVLDAHLGDNDAVIINPYPNAVANRKNIWRRGEKKHPGLLDLARFTGLDRETLLSRYHGVRYTAYCNYIIANEKFWQMYLDHVGPVARALMDAYRAGLIDDLYHHHERPLSNIPYFLERCLADFLLLNDGKIRFHKVNRGKKVYVSQYLVEPYDGMRRYLSS